LSGSTQPRSAAPPKAGQPKAPRNAGATALR
jgi:hypothetical protein